MNVIFDPKFKHVTAFISKTYICSDIFLEKTYGCLSGSSLHLFPNDNYLIYTCKKANEQVPFYESIIFKNVLNAKYHYSKNAFFSMRL